MDRNLAPKELEGEYRLSVGNNKVVITNTVTHQTAMARCHPDDYFDIGEGINEAFGKLNGIHVGDKIEVIDYGESYTTYSDWVYHNVHNIDSCRYAFGCNPENGTIGTVIAIAKHKYSSDNLIYFKKDGNYIFDNSPCYLIGEKGVKKVNQ